MFKKIISLSLGFIMLLLFGLTVFADGSKTLYFNSADDKLYYDPANSVQPDYFMYFENMQPNVVYKDTLVIHNQTKSVYELFFQIIPKENQSARSFYFLSKINMKLTYDGALLFEGTVDALTRKSGINLSEMVSIGTYNSKQTKEIKADIWLDSSLERLFENEQTIYTYRPVLSGKGTKDSPYIYGEEQLEKPNGPYQAAGHTFGDVEGLLAKTTWKFYAEKDGVITPIDPPKTGDNSKTNLYLIVVLVSFGMIVLLFLSKKENKKKKKV